MNYKEYYNSPLFGGKLDDNSLELLLNEIKSTDRILELGSGYSTLMLSTLGNYFISIDNCKEYIDKLLNIDYSLKDKIVLLNVDINEYESKYLGLIKYLYDNNIKYNFIIIDGPMGFKSELPRTNILSLISEGLIENETKLFLHDSNRKGEQRLIQKIKEYLSIFNYHYEIKEYEKCCIFHINKL